MRLRLLNMQQNKKNKFNLLKKNSINLKNLIKKVSQR